MATGHQNEQTDTAWKQAGRPSGKRGRKPKGGPKGRQVSAAALAEITPCWMARAYSAMS